MAKKLVPLLLSTFDENELRELCMDFYLSYEDIPGDTRRQKVMQLVHYFYRRHTLDILINWLSGQRPNVKWPGQRGENGL